MLSERAVMAVDLEQIDMFAAPNTDEHKDHRVDEQDANSIDIVIEKDAVQTFNPSVEIDEKFFGWKETIKENIIFTTKGPTDVLPLSELVPHSVTIIEEAIKMDKIIFIGFSGGKDSSVVVELFLLAMLNVLNSGFRPKYRSLIGSSDTLVENPEIDVLLREKHFYLRKFIAEHDLPIDCEIVKPRINESFFGSVLVGRKLPTTSNRTNRDCTVSWKIQPMNRLRNRHLKMQNASYDDLVLALGSRDAESAGRAASIKKFGGSDMELTPNFPVGSKKQEGWAIYPVKRWSKDQIWDQLSSLGSDKRKILGSYLPNYDETIRTYADAIGECVYNMEDDNPSKKDSCSARFGCWLCTVMTEDRSLNEMINGNPERYGYMKHLARIRDFILRSTNTVDENMRNFLGRTIQPGGFVKLEPDLLSVNTLRRLLHALISADYLEDQRAKDMAQKYDAGLVERNKQNLRLCEPQFQNITEDVLFMVLYEWAFRNYSTASDLFPLKIWKEVYEYGNLELLEDIDAMPLETSITMPSPLYLKVGEKWGIDETNDLSQMGLLDVGYEFAQFEPVREAINTPDGVRTITPVDTAESFTIDNDVIRELMAWEYDYIVEKLDNNPFQFSIVNYLLRSGAVKVHRGSRGKLDQRARRTQMYQSLGIYEGVALEDLVLRDDLTIVSEKRYKEIVAMQRLESVAWEENKRIDTLNKAVSDAMYMCIFMEIFRCQYLKYQSEMNDVWDREQTMFSQIAIDLCVDDYLKHAFDVISDYDQHLSNSDPRVSVCTQLTPDNEGVRWLFNSLIKYFAFTVTDDNQQRQVSLRNFDDDRVDMLPPTVSMSPELIRQLLPTVHDSFQVATERFFEKLSNDKAKLFATAMFSKADGIMRTHLNDQLTMF